MQKQQAVQCSEDKPGRGVSKRYVDNEVNLFSETLTFPFLNSHSRNIIPIPWESYGTHGTRGNSRELFTSTLKLTKAVKQFASECVPIVSLW